MLRSSNKSRSDPKISVRYFYCRVTTDRPDQSSFTKVVCSTLVSHRFFVDFLPVCLALGSKVLLFSWFISGYVRISKLLGPLLIKIFGNFVNIIKPFTGRSEQNLLRQSIKFFKSSKLNTIPIYSTCKGFGFWNILRTQFSWNFLQPPKDLEWI